MAVGGSRRRTLVQLLVGTTLLMIVVRRVVIHEQGALANSAHNPQVAQIVLGDLLHGFFVLTAWILGIAVAILVVALLTGPYRWAVAVRSFVARGLAHRGGRRQWRAAARQGWPGRRPTPMPSSWGVPCWPPYCSSS